MLMSFADIDELEVFFLLAIVPFFLFFGKITDAIALQVAELQTQFPQTKLFPPQVGENVLARPALIEALHTAVFSHRLTLLSAPAGSGKTTAVATLQVLNNRKN